MAVMAPYTNCRPSAKETSVLVDGAITAIGDVLVHRSARLNGQFVEQNPFGS